MLSLIISGTSVLCKEDCRDLKPNHIVFRFVKSNLPSCLEHYYRVSVGLILTNMDAA